MIAAITSKTNHPTIGCMRTLSITSLRVAERF
jgi:hypothetical protein